MLLVVDDLQWADAPSLGFLAYLVRRLEGLPVAVAAAARPALPGETREEIEAIVAEAGGTALTPGPLSPQAVATLAEASSARCPPRSSSPRSSGDGRQRPALDDVLTETAAAASPRTPCGPSRGPRHGAHRPSRHSVMGAFFAGTRAVADAIVVLGDACDLELAATLAGGGSR